MQKNSDYVDSLEVKIERLEQREKLWACCVEQYAYIMRKMQLGKTPNMQNWQELQDCKNKLGIGNGSLYHP